MSAAHSLRILAKHLADLLYAKSPLEFNQDTNLSGNKWGAAGSELIQR